MTVYCQVGDFEIDQLQNNTTIKIETRFII